MYYSLFFYLPITTLVYARHVFPLVSTTKTIFYPSQSLIRGFMDSLCFSTLMQLQFSCIFFKDKNVIFAANIDWEMSVFFVFIAKTKEKGK